MSANQNEALYRRIVEEGFNRGDLRVLDEIGSPSMIEHELLPGQSPGLEGVKEIFTMVRQAFPDLHVTIEDLFTSGDQLCGRITFSGTNSGPFMGRPATGRRASWEAIDILRFESGRLAEHWGEMDMLGMLQQLGLQEMPLAA